MKNKKIKQKKNRKKKKISSFSYIFLKFSSFTGPTTLLLILFA